MHFVNLRFIKQMLILYIISVLITISTNKKNFLEKALKLGLRLPVRFVDFFVKQYEFSISMFFISKIFVWSPEVTLGRQKLVKG